MEWKTEIEEISNSVFKVIMINELGSRIEKTGTDIDAMKEEAINDAIWIEKEINSKLKGTNHSIV